MAIQNKDMWKIETSFETVQVQIIILKIVIMKSTDLKNRWIGQVVVGENFRSWMKGCDNATLVAQYARKFKLGHRTSLGPGDEENSMEA